MDVSKIINFDPNYLTSEVQTAQHWVLPVIKFIGSSTLCK